MKDPDPIAAHRHANSHRQEIETSELCGCFHCLEVFAPAEIGEWIDEPSEGGQTAICPRCGIDSVIGAASGYAITEELLRKMYAHWFAR